MESIVNFLEEKSLYDISEHDLLDVWDADLTQVRLRVQLYFLCPRNKPEIISR